MRYEKMVTVQRTETEEKRGIVMEELLMQLDPLEI